jgi:hypothetical protein
MSMGRVTKTEKASRYGKLLRTTHIANTHAIAMEIMVAVAAAVIEFKRDSLKRGKRKTAVMSEPVMFKSIVPRGQITVANKKIPIISFNKFEPADELISLPLAQSGFSLMMTLQF